MVSWVPFRGARADDASRRVVPIGADDASRRVVFQPVVEALSNTRGLASASFENPGADDASRQVFQHLRSLTFPARQEPTTLVVGGATSRRVLSSLV